MAYLLGVHALTGWHCELRPNTEGMPGRTDGLVFTSSGAGAAFSRAAAELLVQHWDARCSFSKRILHSRMLFDPTSAGLKQAHV
jgi:hypothetical protein